MTTTENKNTYEMKLILTCGEEVRMANPNNTEDLCIRVARNVRADKTTSKVMVIETTPEGKSRVVYESRNLGERGVVEEYFPE